MKTLCKCTKMAFWFHCYNWYAKLGSRQWGKKKKFSSRVLSFFVFSLWKEKKKLWDVILHVSTNLYPIPVIQWNPNKEPSQVAYFHYEYVIYVDWKWKSLYSCLVALCFGLFSLSLSRDSWPGSLCWSMWKFSWRWEPASCGVKLAVG